VLEKFLGFSRGEFVWRLHAVNLAPASLGSERGPSLTHNDPGPIKSSDPHPPSRPHERTDAESDFKSSTSASCSGLKILVSWGVTASEGRHQIRRGQARHSISIRSGQGHSTGKRESPHRQSSGRVFWKAQKGQCSVLLLTAQAKVRPRSGCYPVKVRLLLGPSAFQNEPPSEPDGSAQKPSVDTRGVPNAAGSSGSGTLAVRKRLR
jgi:hypothetical protein